MNVEYWKRQFRRAELMMAEARKHLEFGEATTGLSSRDCNCIRRAMVASGMQEQSLNAEAVAAFVTDRSDQELLEFSLCGPKTVSALRHWVKRREAARS